MTGITLADYGVDERLGFLPGVEPLRRLSDDYAEWDEIAAAMPKLLRMGRARHLLEQVPPLDTTALRTPAEVERAMLLLSYFAHGYLNDSDPPMSSIPGTTRRPIFSHDDIGARFTTRSLSSVILSGPRLPRLGRGQILGGIISGCTINSKQYWTMPTPT